MSDELRDQLKKVDPMHSGVPTEPVTTESSRARLESIMSTPIVERPETRDGRRTIRWVAAAAGVAAAVVVVGVLVLNSGGEAPAPAAQPLALTAPANDAMAMCIQFSTEALAQAPVALEGTVTAIEGDVVTVDVDHWYKGGDAEQVVITAPAGLQALIGGIEFDQGGQYLITAYDGVVNYCGFSGPSTPELRAAFDEAFPA